MAIKSKTINKKDIIELYQKHASIGELSKTYKTSKQTIRNILKAANIPIRTGSEQCKLTANKKHSNLQDQKFDNGSIIYWSQPRSRDKRGSSVKAFCGKCHQYRWIQPGVTKKPTYTGLCIRCASKETSPKGKNHPLWKGGKIHSKQGYIYINKYTVPNWNKWKSMATHDFYILEHRLVMAQSLKRPLASKEIVHHLNGIKDDNRLENLLLVTRQSHAKEEVKILNYYRNHIRKLEKQIKELKQQIEAQHD